MQPPRQRSLDPARSLLRLRRWGAWVLLLAFPLAAASQATRTDSSSVKLSRLLDPQQHEHVDNATPTSTSMQDSRSLRQAGRGIARKTADGNDSAPQPPGPEVLPPGTDTGVNSEGADKKPPTGAPVAAAPDNSTDAVPGGTEPSEAGGKKEAAPAPTAVVDETKETALAPVGKGKPNKGKEPTLAPKAAPDPTPAPTLNPTLNPTQEVVAPAPVKNPKPQPTEPTEPTDPPATTNDVGCDQPKNCENCKELAKTVKKEHPLSTCVFSGSPGQCKDGLLADNPNPIECPGDEPKSNEKPIAPDDEPEENNMVLFGALGAMALCLVMVCRRVMGSRSSVPMGSPGLGKYQGVTTLSDDDDNEWGWDDNPKPSVEMSKFGQAGHTPDTSARYRRGASPHNSHDNSPSSPKNERKGLSVKKSGMRNPLSTTSAPAPPTQSYAARQPVVKKLVVPKPDDFFAEMGLETKPTFPTSTSNVRGNSAVKRLGATSLPMDNWGDDDLDDLLDD